PSGTLIPTHSLPAINRWATIIRPYGPVRLCQLTLRQQSRPRDESLRPGEPKAGSLPSQIAQRRRNPGALTLGTPLLGYDHPALRGCALVPAGASPVNSYSDINFPAMSFSAHLLTGARCVCSPRMCRHGSGVPLPELPDQI